MQLCFVFELKLSKETIQIAQPIDEQVFDDLISLVKANQNVAFVCFAPQLFRKRRFAYTPSSFEKQSVVRSVLFLPFEHFLKNFSLKHCSQISFFTNAQQFSESLFTIAPINNSSLTQKRPDPLRNRACI